MSALEPLTGARIPTQSDGPLGGLQIANAVTDIADNTIPFFTTTSARDTAYNAWVTAGGTMRNSLVCAVGDLLYKYRVGTGWLAQTGESYHATAGGGIGITTANLPSAPGASTAQLALPVGVWDLNYSGSFALSVSSAGREFTLWAEQASVGQVASTKFTVNTVGGSSDTTWSAFDRVTLASAATLYLRVKANATGGTQQLNTTALRAVRVG